MTPRLPLVSCIMPTRDRRAFVGRAIEYFRRQTYPRAELVVVDDGDDSVADMAPQTPGVTCIRLGEQRSIGFKRNVAIERARGDIVVHWDDDDWYGPERLRHQVDPLLRGRAHVSGLKTGFMLDVLDGRFWSCRADLHARMFYADLHGGTIAYLKTLWSTIARFPDSSLAEDAAFLRAVTGRATIAALPNDDTFVYVRHGSNAWEFVCGRAVDAGAWMEAAPPPCMEGDMPFYRQLGSTMAADTTSVKRYGDTCRRAGSHREALQYYLRAIELDRDNVWAWFDKGLTLEALGRHGQALDAVLQADRLLHPQDGNRTWLHAQLGQLYARLGRTDLARQQYHIAVSLDPSNTAARRALDRLRG